MSTPVQKKSQGLGGSASKSGAKRKSLGAGRDSVSGIGPDRFLRILRDQPAATKADHVLRSRVLLAPQDAEDLELEGATAVLLAFEEGKPLTCTWSTLQSLRSGTCAVSQEVLDVASEGKCRIKPLKGPVRYVETLCLSTTDRWTATTKRYILSRLDGLILGEGAYIGVYLAGLLRSIRVLQVSEPSVVLDDEPKANDTSDETQLVTLCNYGRVSASQTRLLTLNDEDEQQTTTKRHKEPFAGLEKELESLLDVIGRTFEYNGKSNTKLTPSRGALIYGPPGTGKTLLVNAIFEAFPACARFVLSEDVDEGVQKERIEAAFASSKPAILFIDEIDSFSSNHKSLVTSLIHGCDNGRPSTFLVACANNVDEIEPALRRPGRLDEEIEVPPPSQAQRLAILKAHLGQFTLESGLLESQGLKRLADTLHGFVGADIALLVREAAYLCLESAAAEDFSLEKALDSLSLSSEKADQRGGELTLTLAALESASKRVSPSCLREVQVTVPEVRWDDIGGMGSVKQAVRECVELPLKHPEAFKRLGIRPPQGVLLYGPPGCSKTLLAKAVATESEMNFIAVKGPELLSKWVGDSEKAIRATFRRAKQSRPCVIFFDEMDALASSREGGSSSASSVSHRVTSQLLQELDGIEARTEVMVLCATNRPDLLDPALLRPGRIDRMVYVPPPDAAARRAILEINLKRIPHNFSLDQLDEVATDGFSGAEVASICKTAALTALERDENTQFITLDDLKEAASKVVLQITSNVLAFYEDFAKRHTAPV